ncbi:MAG: hypothetical protein WBM86_07045 [Waterburya sp.]
MKFKSFLNGSVLFLGLGLTAYAWLNGFRLRFNVEDVAVEEQSEETGQKFEKWQLKPGSMGFE